MLAKYIDTNYDALKQMAHNITHGRYPDCEELLHWALLAVMEADRDKMEAIIQRRQMRYWVARIMMNQYNSSGSKYHYLYRAETKRLKAAASEIETWHDDTLPAAEQKEALLQQLETHLAGISDFDRNLTTVYYLEHHSLSSLSAATGISRTTIYKAIRRTRHEIQKKFRAGGHHC